MGKEVKLTKDGALVLEALLDRSLDVFDLSDKVKREVATVMIECTRLRNNGLVNWMYAEDEVALEPAGRAALEANRE